MDPVTVIAVASGLLDLLEKLAPEVQAAFSKGQISAEDQAKLNARVENLDFSGPEWKPSDAPPTTAG